MMFQKAKGVVLAPARAARHIVRLMRGWAAFSRSGKTPGFSYQSMVALFCMTQGKSNDVLHSLVKLANPPYPLQGNEGVLGRMTPERVHAMVSDIRDKGYHVFEEKLSTEACANLLAFSLENEGKVRLTTEEVQAGAPTKYLKLDRLNPQGIRYDFSENFVFTCPEAQRLAADPSILSLAQGYLECKPILDIVTLWWHTYSSKPDEEAAQFYHFDMDRIKWLKFFFYVTEVKTENGPHCFVAKSHRTGGIPRHLLKKGYHRLTDEEVQGVFPDKADFIEFTGLQGTIIAEDTRGLHKGKHVEAGDRLVFQLEFCDSMFGAEYHQGTLPGAMVPELKRAVDSYPRIYSKFSKAI